MTMLTYTFPNCWTKNSFFGQLDSLFKLINQCQRLIFSPMDRTGICPIGRGEVCKGVGTWMQKQKVYTMSEAAKLIGVSRQSIYKKIDRPALQEYLSDSDKGKVISEKGLNVLRKLFEE